MRAKWALDVEREWGTASRNAKEQQAGEGSPKGVRKSNPNFMDIPTDVLFANLAAQVASSGPSAEHPPDAVLLDLIDPPRLTALLRKLLVTDEWTALRMFAIQSRTYATSTHTQSDLGTRGYIGWHRDFEGPGIGISVDPAAVIKVSHGRVCH
jgi:hypothetical protein